MVQSKSRRKPGSTVAAPKQPPRVRAASSGLSFKDYMLLNVLFSGFCLLQLFLVRLLLRDFAGLYFFFIFLMVSFLVVSLFDYFSNKFGIGDQIEGNNVPIDEHL